VSARTSEAPQVRVGLGALARSRLSRPDFIAMVMPYLMLAVLIAWLGKLQPASLSWDEINVMVNGAMVLILLAIGQSFVLITGGIDLSIGGVLSVVSAYAASHMATDRDVVVSIVVLLALSWLPGLINGALVAYAGLQPFIVTLATWFVWSGIAFYFLSSAGGLIDESLSWLSTGTIGEVRVSTVAAVLALVAGSWIMRSKIGLQMKAVGSDEVAAYDSGIPTARVKVLAYMLSSVWAVLAGIMLSAQSLAGDPTVGNSYILPMITAVVIGGASLAGGRASTTGSAVGALVLTYVTSVTFAEKLPAEWGLIIVGLLLIGTVSAQTVVRVTLRQEELP
jgi:ribose transport system permease protein